MMHTGICPLRCLALAFLFVPHIAMAQDRSSTEPSFVADIRPLLKKYCHECHAGDRTEAEIDLAAFRTPEELAAHTKVWVRVLEMLDTEQMPPIDSLQPNDAERTRLRTWVRDYLVQEATSRAGDPGPVVLRRLSNAEYTYSIQDLTGLETLDPAREFPVDGAAGEGFTNVGSALVMSPSLLQKFMDAARSVADHAALYPNGVRFEPQTSARDLTDEKLRQIQEFYARYTTAGGGITVNLTGQPFKTNQGGVLPLADYLRATLEAREALRAGKSVQQLAIERQLSPRYLKRLWAALNDRAPSPLLDPVRTRWRTATPNQTPQLVRQINEWSPRLWKFNIVGHLGREGAPQQWMQPVEPLVERQEFRVELPPAANADVSVWLSAEDAHDGNQGDYVRWRDLRIEGDGQLAVPLQFVAALHQRMQQRRQELIDRLPDYLAAAAEAATDERHSVAALANQFELREELLEPWLRYLGTRSGGAVKVTDHYSRRLLNSGGYDFIDGWGSPATPSIVANASDQEVTIPGRVRPHSLAMHPSPTRFTAIGWQSPIDGVVRVDAEISDAHPSCGNGAEWHVRHRTATHTATLGTDVFGLNGSGRVTGKTIAVSRGEVVSLLVGPREMNHYCDMTAVNLTITEVHGQKQSWNAARDLSANLAESNPRADRFGNQAVWHFYTGPMAEVEVDKSVVSPIPPGSLLAKWLEAKTPASRKPIAEQLAQVAGDRADPPADGTPDALVLAHLRSFPLAVTQNLLQGLQADPRFGSHPLGHKVDQNHLVVKAPARVEFRIPAELAANRELVVSGEPDPEHGTEASVQLAVLTKAGSAVPSASDIVCADGSQARQRLLRQFDDFRKLFPPALCYTRIVPVDEVVTATLFHREDRLLRELMLADDEAAELDRLWDELLWVSEEPLKLVVALEQIREFSTQDRQELVTPWDRMKPAVQSRADAFERRRTAAEPRHVGSVLALAERAWRRSLSAEDRESLKALYQRLRETGLGHEQSIRLLITRVLTSPDFLYRRETPPDGPEPGRVTNTELAVRLSYFLTSSLPDEQLTAAVRNGRLGEDANLLAHTRRLLRQPTARRLAVHFMCQWLHLRDFDQTTEKNEKLFPGFAGLKSAMNEEPIRFFADLVRNDRSILEAFDADHTFVNGPLAAHYGLSVPLADWQRVSGVRAVGRGGVLGMSAVLASQSGASRSSPILRGTWVSESLLGERLPKPPANVPVLPESVPPGLTARQLIQRHSSVRECARCHRRIDPYGFALEQFDTVGARRASDVDTSSVLPDGTRIDGLPGLRRYLLTQRRDDVVRQFCRKLLGYALGREVLLSDEQLLARMQTRLAENDYRFSAAVETIVLSRQFRTIRGQAHKGSP